MVEMEKYSILEICNVEKTTIVRGDWMFAELLLMQPAINTRYAKSFQWSQLQVFTENGIENENLKLTTDKEEK
jgi:hypothetical protein